MPRARTLSACQVLFTFSFNGLAASLISHWSSCIQLSVLIGLQLQYPPICSRSAFGRMYHFNLCVRGQIMVASLAVRDYLWCNIDSTIHGWARQSGGPCVTRLQTFIPSPEDFLASGLCSSSYRASKIRAQSCTCLYTFQGSPDFLKCGCHIRILQPPPSCDIPMSMSTSISTMDHEKPEVVSPRVYEYLSEATRSPVSPDLDYPRTPSVDEPGNVDEQKDPKGDSVWYAMLLWH